MKLAEKYVNGELEESDEACLEEASSKKSSKKTKTGSFIAGVLKFLIWIGIVGVGTVAAGAWVISKIGSVASVMVKGMQDVSRRLSESIALECADDAQQLEEADAEELDECGNPVEDSSPAAMVHQGKSIAEWAKLFKGEFSVSQLARMALSGTDLGQLLLAADGISDIYDSEKPEDMNEADYREKASHLLDPVGVKASTASLKAQDTAMISVVETLLKKIDRLEEKVDASKKRDVETDEAEEQVREARERDLSKVDKSVTNCLMQHISELTPQVMQD